MWFMGSIYIGLAMDEAAYSKQPLKFLSLQFLAKKSASSIWEAVICSVRT